MKPIVIQTSALSNDDNGVCESQSAAGAADLLINGALATGGVATIAEAQIITITCAGDETGVIFTITGEDADGITITDPVTGVNGAAAVSVKYFRKITSVATDGATTSTVIIGPISSNGAVTRSVRVNRNQVSSFKLGQFVELSSGASMTYTAQHSPDWPESGDYTAGYSDAANWYSTDGLTALTATDESNIVIPLETVRLLISAYTSGTATFTTQQNY